MMRRLITIISWMLCIAMVSAQEEEDFFRYDPIFGQDNTLAENCDIYLAPSEIGGWGVYAGRDYEENEVIEIVPRFLALKNEWLNRNVLDDYHYGFTFQQDPSETSFGAVIFGKAMFYNHGVADQQNVIYTNFGRDPDKHTPWASNMLGYVAKKAIQRGEELLCTYGETGQWFTDRDLVMQDLPQRQLPTLEKMKEMEEKHCSNIVAGIGHSTWVQRIMPSQTLAGYGMPVFDYESRLPLQNHPTAIAKSFLQEGQVLELSPAVVVPAEDMRGSPLSPMVIYWYDLDDSHKEAIRELREMGAFRMKGISNETGYHVLDVLEYFDDASILPAGGNIALVRKVGDHNPNCRMEIMAPVESEEELDYGSAGLVLKLIATRDIQSGEELRLNLPDNSSWDSRESLQQHLALLGQPIPRHIVESFNPDIGTPPEGEDTEPEF